MDSMEHMCPDFDDGKPLENNIVEANEKSTNDYEMLDQILLMYGINVTNLQWDDSIEDELPELEDDELSENIVRYMFDKYPLENGNVLPNTIVVLSAGIAYNTVEMEAVATRTTEVIGLAIKEMMETEIIPTVKEVYSGKMSQDTAILLVTWVYWVVTYIVRVQQLKVLHWSFELVRNELAYFGYVCVLMDTGQGTSMLFTRYLYVGATRGDILKLIVDKQDMDGVEESFTSLLSMIHDEILELMNLEGCRKVADVSVETNADNCPLRNGLDVFKYAIIDYSLAALSYGVQVSL
ncbi:hypothetical protein RND71_025544 [Anisodus tanguticus]|uniref:Uncharacterized protein n=1 Tax=Anisodus tanguticus TaxID=243964 RepID=A0AAE1V4Y0_9SOLA|nr:hypothetical protein RND71_025544 [Anisodus tanguticus]